MNQIYLLISALCILIGCSDKSQQGDDFDINSSKPPQSIVKVKASEMIDLKNKGVGEVTNVKLDEVVNDQLALEGESLFTQKCMICHKVDERFIGPPLGKVLNRRTPEWVMNMMLNPDIMIKEDSLAKAVFMEYNGSPMANQGLTYQEARKILEYLRTTSG